MILAAGRGERLRPLTDTTPKPLLVANNRMLIEHHLDHLAAGGFRDIVINIGHLGEQIIDTLGNGSRYGLNITYSDERENVLETGGGICKALPLLKSDPFLVINGDIWTDYDFAALPREISTLAHLVMVENPDHHAAGDFSLHSGKVHEKQPGQSAWTYSGIGIYTHRLFNHCKVERFPLAPLLREYMRKGGVSGELYRGEWMDIGTKERLDDLSRRLAADVKDR
jgi:MurNAc alpha-1-phosphate uridylyltransferase